MTIILTIPGRVVSHKNNYKIVKRGKRSSLARNDKLNECRNRIRVAAYESGFITPDFPPDAKLWMGLTIYTTKPFADIDGVATTVFDALEKIIYESDSQIWKTSLHRVKVAKRADEYIIVELKELE